MQSMAGESGEHHKQVGDGSHAHMYSLLNAGRAGPDQPKRYYQFALIDPIGQPFATFRYYYRTWDQLRDLGLLDEEWNGAGEENDLSVIEPNEPSDREMEKDSTRHVSSRESITPRQETNDSAGDQNRSDDDNGDSRNDNNINNSTTPTSKRAPNPGKIMRPSTPGVALHKASDTLPQPNPNIPCNVPQSSLELSDEHLDEQAQQRLSYVCAPPQFYRFSASLPVKFDPPEPARPLPTIPPGNVSSLRTSNHPYPVNAVSDSTARAQSPVKQVGERVFTPPLRMKTDDVLSTSSLMKVISSTWKRRGTQSASNGTYRRDGARSVP